MYKNLQPLVNAQVDVNRAVFEGNKSNPNEKYIKDCVASAIKSLQQLTIKKKSSPKKNNHGKKP